MQDKFAGLDLDFVQSPVGFGGAVLFIKAFVLLCAGLIAVMVPAMGWAETVSVTEMVVGEVRVGASCDKCKPTILSCAARVDREAEMKLIARNKMSGVITIFEGETRVFGDYTLHCVQRRAEKLFFYIDFGCAMNADFQRHRKTLEVTEFVGTKITAATERELERTCQAAGRELYFNALGNLPKLVRSGVAE